MQTQSSKLPNEFHSVQYLRGIAAVAVVYFHTKIYLAGCAWPLGRQFGYGGVDLFFAISGFIMMVTTSAKTESPFLFYLKRIVRVAPLYWGATLASAALFLLVPSAFIKQDITFEHVLLSMLFIPHPSPSEAGAAPFFKIGWTLNFEMFFYLVFGLALLLRTALHRLVAISVFFIGMTLYGLVFQPQGAALGYYTSPFLLEFVAGAIVGYLTFTGHVARIPRSVLPYGVAVAVMCFLFGGGVGDGFARVLLFGVPAACLVAFAVAAEQRGIVPTSRALELLGNASYSIYLAHPFVLTGFKVGARALHVPTEGTLAGGLTVILSVVVTVLFGYLVFRLVERPLLKIMRALVLSRVSAKPGLQSAGV